MEHYLVTGCDPRTKWRTSSCNANTRSSVEAEQETGKAGTHLSRVGSVIHPQTVGPQLWPVTSVELAARWQDPACGVVAGAAADWPDACWCALASLQTTTCSCSTLARCRVCVWCPPYLCEGTLETVSGAWCPPCLWEGTSETVKCAHNFWGLLASCSLSYVTDRRQRLLSSQVVQSLMGPVMSIP